MKEHKKIKTIWGPGDIIQLYYLKGKNINPRTMFAEFLLPDTVLRLLDLVSILIITDTLLIR